MPALRNFVVCSAATLLIVFSLTGCRGGSCALGNHGVSAGTCSSCAGQSAGYSQPTYAQPVTQGYTQSAPQYSQGYSTPTYAQPAYSGQTYSAPVSAGSGTIQSAPSFSAPTINGSNFGSSTRSFGGGSVGGSGSR